MLNGDNNRQQLRLISGEFLIIMLTLFSMAAGAIWYIGTLDGRVGSLEKERDLGKRNTLADGLVRDVQIQALMELAKEHKILFHEMGDKLDSIAEDVAVLRSRP